MTENENYLTPKQAAFEMLLWLDNNSTSVHQALIMAAERNEEDATKIETDNPAGEMAAVVTVLRQSGQSWRRHAADLHKIQERTPEGFDVEMLGLV